MSLPAFLIAFANNKLVWLGFRKYALPAVGERWSFGRWFALVAIKTTLAVILGLLISLAVAGQPMSWLLCLLGLLAACQSMVMSGLTALCWNQRAAGLRENPILPMGLPPARHRLGRWALGLVYFALLAVITPVAMVVTVENIYGQWAWNREQSRLVAQGEKLTLTELRGPAIPAEQNAGAAPIFTPFFDYAPDGYKLCPEATNAIGRFRKALFLPYDRLPDRPPISSPAAKRFESMEEWSAAYRQMAAAPAEGDPAWATALKLPPPGNAARDVLAGLAAGDAVMADVCAAAARPRSQFPVRFEQGFSVVLEHLSSFKLMQQNLKVRCAAHLAAGETEAAFADATNALNVAELLREEPLLISQLVRMAQGALATATLWEGLVTHRWTDPQLAAFQERLARVDYLPGLIRGFEGERACGIVGVDGLIAGRGASGDTSGGLRRAALVLPLGMMRQNQVALARAHTALLADLREAVPDLPSGGFAAHLKARADREADRKQGEPYLGLGTRTEKLAVESTPYSPFTVLAKMVLPAVARAETRAARVQTMNYMTITVCGLERFRLAHGSYPETLDALVPASMPKPLLDPMTGKPFHYQRTNDGWFLLYSIGDDGKDDGGVFRTKQGDPIKDWPWPVPTRPDVGSFF